MSELPPFESFEKIPRLSRDIVVTEKIDGTNAQIFISDDGYVFAGSRNRYVTPGQDNFGFAAWVAKNQEELIVKLGPGRHYGEWWGNGIGRGYGLKERRFSLFNTHIWGDDSVRPACCGVVPVLYHGAFSTEVIDSLIEELRIDGSYAAPGFMNPEGIIIFHTASNHLYKKTLENDGKPKGMA